MPEPKLLTDADVERLLKVCEAADGPRTETSWFAKWDAVQEARTALPDALHTIRELRGALLGLRVHRMENCWCWNVPTEYGTHFTFCQRARKALGEG